MENGSWKIGNKHKEDRQDEAIVQQDGNAGVHFGARGDGKGGWVCLLVYLIPKQQTSWKGNTLSSDLN